MKIEDCHVLFYVPLMMHNMLCDELDVFFKVDLVVKNIMSSSSDFPSVTFSFLSKECNYILNALVNRGRIDI